MAERAIRLYGDPVLTSATARIEEVTPSVRALVSDLLDTVTPEGRAGVAATQIGVGLSAFSYNVDGVVDYVLNPELVEVRGEVEDVEEGCLSVPGLWFPTPRHPFARVRGIDLDGRVKEVSGEGLLAQALQHETDHLSGTLYIDRLAPENRREARRQIRLSDWF